MKIINSGGMYRFYGDDIKTFDKLPAGSFTIGFSSNSGFFLMGAENFSITEKIYGSHEKKVEKVFRTYNDTQRNLGIILSGNKGIGKSLFAKLLSEKAVMSGLPVIIVSSYIPGIADFLNTIDQRCVVLFDEFDKTFCDRRENRDTARDPQTEMLSLFDGINTSEKMFVITCNDLSKLSEFIVNRPGRFHYHFRFDYPSKEELKEYLQDHLLPEYWGEIESVIKFASKVRLNFDCLRSIAFELNTGETFKNAIVDLNITTFGDMHQNYRVVLTFSDGSTRTFRNCQFDAFSDEEVNWEELAFEQYHSCLDISFNPCHLEPTEKDFVSAITNPALIKTEWNFWNKDAEDEDERATREKVQTQDIKCVKIECTRNYSDSKYLYKGV